MPRGVGIETISYLLLFAPPPTSFLPYPMELAVALVGSVIVVGAGLEAVSSLLNAILTGCSRPARRSPSNPDDPALVREAWIRQEIAMVGT